jgi:hypothetical protein
VRRTVPPSAEIEEQIDRLLSLGVGEHPRESLSELARLGARLIIQRAVEDEFDAWLGRGRYERRVDGARVLAKRPGVLLNHCNVDRQWKAWLTKHVRINEPAAGQVRPNTVPTTPCSRSYSPQCGRRRCWTQGRRPSTTATTPCPFRCEGDGISIDR